MPGMTGFELLERLDESAGRSYSPTAYDQYAIHAFEVNALDYLLKPIAPTRLAAALARLRPRPERSRLEQVFVRDGDRCWTSSGCPTSSYSESEGNYTRLHFGSERPLIRRSFEPRSKRQLDPNLFFRAGRKEIINLKWN